MAGFRREGHIYPKWKSTVLLKVSKDGYRINYQQVKSLVANAFMKKGLLNPMMKY